MSAHSILLKYQKRFAMVLMAIVLGVTAISGTTQFAQHATASHEAVVRSNRFSFYREIAGKQDGTVGTVSNRLALDLRSALGSQNAKANELPDSVTGFLGTSNSYGGIKDAIGVDPFDGRGLSCVECGPLTGDMQLKLLEIKRGKVESLIKSESPVASTGFNLVPANLSTVEYILLLWAVGGTMGLIFSHLLAKSKSGYVRRFSDLSWEPMDERTIMASTLLALPTFIVMYPFRRIMHSRLDKKIRREYSGSMSIVDDIDLTLDKISLRYGDDPRVEKLQADRDAIYSQIRLLARNDGEEEKLNQSIDDAQIRLGSLKDWLANRSDSLNELHNGSVAHS